MRRLLVIIAALVLLALLNAAFYDSRYTQATNRMIAQIAVHFWGKY